MKHSIAILFLICLFFMCNYSEKTTNEQPFTTIWYSCFFLPNIETVNTRVLTDKNDGTIELAVTTGQRSNIPYCFFHNRTTTIRTLFKKCLQGQVYRQPQNDCQGTGTASNNFGAQTFQWCPTNDNSCDVRGLNNQFFIANENISPAAISCKNENFKSLKWSLSRFVENNFDKPGSISNTRAFQSLFGAGSIWDNSDGVNPTLTISSTGSFDLNGNFKSLDVQKNTFNNVLCYSN